MTSRDIILANLNHMEAPRPGMTFDGGRVNDMLGVGIGGNPDYTPKRWTEGDKEFYDEEWGNVWARMVGGCMKGEVVTPALPSWDGLGALKLPDYEDSSRYTRMKEIIDDLIDCGVDCFQFDQPALYDMPALARKFCQRQVALWSPTDIQKVLPTGNRAFIESETQRLLETFEGCLITKNYPDLPGIGVQPEWDMWAYDVVAGYNATKP